MISMSLTTLAGLLDVESVQADISITGVTIDSRKNCKGQLFIAIRGERFDGHDYVEVACRSGAAAALVEYKVDCNIPQIVVADCKQAMIRLAQNWRRRCAARVIALTGSNGKTTVKEMVFHILQKQAPTHATQGNYNNDIGVPLTLFELATDDDYAVIELGANHRGEITALAQIAEPDIVYVNNVAAAHLAGFGSVQGVIDAKGELYEYCQPQHCAVFNNDEVASRQWKSRCAAETQLNCALNADADVSAKWLANESGLALSATYKGQTKDVLICVFGEHNARNALAAITISMAAGIEFSQAVKNLAGFSGVKGRLQMIGGPDNSVLINDSYNANPDSLAAAINVLCDMQGEAWLALGDMGELGEEAEKLHIEAAKLARKQGVRKMFGIGPLSCIASREFVEQGFCCEQIDDMAKLILVQIHQGVNLLIKGSRSAGMEKLVEILLGSSQQVGNTRHAL